MRKKSDLLKIVSIAAIAGSMTQSFPAAAAPSKGTKSVECFGINTCKETNGCSVSRSQIDTAKAVYGDRFEKAMPFDCSGNADGSAKSGYLAWVKKASNEECFAEGGFVFEKKDGKLSIVTKKS